MIFQVVGERDRETEGQGDRETGRQRDGETERIENNAASDFSIAT